MPNRAARRHPTLVGRAIGVAGGGRLVGRLPTVEAADHGGPVVPTVFAGENGEGVREEWMFVYSL